MNLATKEFPSLSPPHVALAGSRTLLAWSFSGERIDFDVMARMGTVTPYQLGEATQLDTPNVNEHAVFPDVALAADGTGWVVWQGAQEIVARRLVGGAWGPRLVLDSNHIDALLPRVQLDEGGCAIAIWLAYDGGRYRVWGSQAGKR